MRTVLQSETNECGLAALATIAGIHGHEISLQDLRRRYSHSQHGVKLSTLIEIASDLNFHTRALRVDLDDLAYIPLPCLLHWDLDHFVVLAKVSKRKLVILDPARGERTITPKELSLHFTGIALELTPGTNFKTAKRAKSLTLAQLLHGIRGLSGTIASILVLSLVLQLFVLLAPLLLQWVVDQVIVNNDPDMLSIIVLALLLSTLVQVGLEFTRGWALVYLASKIAVEWLSAVFSHLVRLPQHYFLRRHLGDVTSRIYSTREIQRTLTTSFVQAFIDGLMGLVTLGLIFLYSVKLALITVAGVSLYFLLTWTLYHSYRSRKEQFVISSARQDSYLMETIRGIQSVKTLGIESRRQASYANLTIGAAGDEFRLGVFETALAAARNVIFGVERVAVIGVAAALTLNREFSVGMLIAYLAYKEMFTSRMQALNEKALEIRMLGLHVDRLADVLETPIDERHTRSSFRQPGAATVEFRNVSFRYSESDPWIVENCNFKVFPGESIAITGVSGAGKSTILKLICGLLEPCSGSVLVGDVDLKSGFPSSLLSRYIGAVMQDDQLFAGTIADNISSFDESASDELIISSAKAAAIDGEVLAMPLGYETLIGDMGSALSGGQKQRVILARALYRQPRILLLDEATSSLDVENERAVSEHIKSQCLTRIIVAHRPETIATADRVLLLSDRRLLQLCRDATETGSVSGSTAVEASYRL